MGFNAGTFLTDVWFTGSLMPSTLGTSMTARTWMAGASKWTGPPRRTSKTLDGSGGRPPLRRAGHVAAAARLDPAGRKVVTARWTPGWEFRPIGRIVLTVHKEDSGSQHGSTALL